MVPSSTLDMRENWNEELEGIRIEAVQFATRSSTIHACSGTARVYLAASCTESRSYRRCSVEPQIQYTHLRAAHQTPRKSIEFKLKHSSESLSNLTAVSSRRIRSSRVVWSSMCPHFRGLFRLYGEGDMRMDEPNLLSMDLLAGGRSEPRLLYRECPSLAA